MRTSKKLFQIITKKTIFKILFFSSLVFLYSYQLCVAQKINANSSDDILFFAGEDLFVVSASKFIEPVTEAPAIIEIITAKEIRRTGARTLSELLRWHSGWHIILGRDSKSLPFVRGLGSRHPNKVLVMVNGTPYKDGFYQDFIYDEYFPLEIIQRIELIRGPGSVLYGSNALIGVINIITKKPDELPAHDGALIVKGGSRQTFYSTAIAGMKTKKSSFIAHVRWFQSDNEGPDYSHRGVNNIDEAGFRKKALSAGFSYQASDFHVSAQIIDYHTPQIVETDRAYFGNNGGWSRYNFMSETGWDHTFSEIFSLNTKVYWQFYNNNSRWGSALPPWEDNPVYEQNDVTTKTERIGGGLQANWTVTDWMKIVSGVDYELNRILKKEDLVYDSEWDTTPRITLYAPSTDVDEYGFYLQDTLQFWNNKLGITLGGRFVNNELFGNFFTPRGGIVYSPWEWMTTKILYGEAYRSPNGRELFTDPNGDWTAGNRDLKPEEIQTFETQIIFKPLKKLNFSVTYCDVKTEKDIEEAPADVPSGRQWQNLTGTKTNGFELNLHYDQGRFTTFANASLYNITNRATGERKKFVPETMWNLGVSAKMTDEASVMLIWNHIGDRKKISISPEDFQNKIDNGDIDTGISYEEATMGGKAYNVLDLTFNWKNLLPKPFIKASFSVYNLLDEKYSDFPMDPGDEAKKLDTGYLHPGRNFLMMLTFQL